MRRQYRALSISSGMIRTFETENARDLWVARDRQNRRMLTTQECKREAAKRRRDS